MWMYSDMPSAIYEWIKDGYAWTPACEWCISGDCALDYLNSEFCEIIIPPLDQEILKCQ